MNINESFEFLNFWISKDRGEFFTIPELTEVVDRGQMSLYEDLQPDYATSQRIKDALAPFKASYNFTPVNTISGFIVIPSNSNYLNLLDVMVTFTVSGKTGPVYFPVKMVNEDERANRLNSQLSPVTTQAPFGEMMAPRFIKLWPQAGYTGTVTYLRRPLAPVFGYNIISGRVVVYDPATSVQLEWPENWQNALLVKALSSIGINLTDDQVINYAQLKSQSNFENQNML